MGARENLDKRWEVLHKSELCLNLLLCCSKNQKTQKEKQWAVSSKEHQKSQRKNKAIVTGFRAKNFYNPHKILTDGAKKFYGLCEIILWPSRRNRIKVVIRTKRFCFAQYKEKFHTKILWPCVKMRENEQFRTKIPESVQNRMDSRLKKW